MTSDVSVTARDRIQTIRLQRPAKKNAMTTAMYAALLAALVDGDNNPAVSAHVIVGSQGVFSAGNDITDFLAHAQAGGGLTGPGVEFIRYLPRVAKPLIAAVDGMAVGVGVTLLLHCDLVYASPTAVFRTPFLDLGLVPEAGSSLLAPMRMGHVRAFEMLALGEAFNADKALSCGLINAIVPVDKLEAAAHAAAAKLAARPPEALALCRKLIRGDASAISARIEEEVAIFSRQLGSAEAREAFTAFLEKRPPDFRRGGG